MANRWRGQWTASPPGGWVAGDGTRFGQNDYICTQTGTTSQPGTDGTWSLVGGGGGGGSGSQQVANAIYMPLIPVDPGVNPVAGGLLFVSANGALKYRSPAGTVTTVGAA